MINLAIILIYFLYFVPSIELLDVDCRIATFAVLMYLLFNFGVGIELHDVFAEWEMISILLFFH